MPFFREKYLPFTKSEEYKKRVLKLAEKLREDGIDVILDHWNCKIGMNRFFFMENSIRTSDKVLILCEETYTEKADNKDVSGVGIETSVITPEVYGKNDQQKFIPVIMEDPFSLPTYLKSCVVIDNRNDDGYEDILHAAYGVGIDEPPPLLEMPGVIKKKFSERAKEPLKTKTDSVEKLVIESPEYDSLLTIANRYKAQGDYAKALEYYDKALVIQEKVLGSDHPDTASTYGNMATLYNKRGYYTKALEYHEKAREIREKVLGLDHPDTAATYNNMANLYADLGDSAKALEYHDKACVIWEKVLGSDHPDTAMTYNNIATVYRKLGNYAKALGYYEKARVIQEKVLGSDHLDTATTYNDMAIIYNIVGNYTKALKYCDKALVVREKVLGTDHPGTATTYDNMANVYRDQGDYPKAREYYLKALVIQEKVLGLNHPDTAKTYSDIGMLYYKQREYQESKKYCKIAYDIYFWVTIHGVVTVKTPNTWNDFLLPMQQRLSPLLHLFISLQYCQ